MECANDHPKPLDFTYRKHSYILEKHFVLYRKHCCVLGKHFVYVIARNYKPQTIKKKSSRTNENNECATCNVLKSSNVLGLINDGIQSNIDNNADNNTTDAVFQECDNVVSVEGLRIRSPLISEIISRLHIPSEEITENDWIKILTSGGLTEPSEHLLETLQMQNRYFVKFIENCLV
ncbi:hypothetical protein PR048_009787, partial [Dryococelus australis]